MDRNEITKLESLFHALVDIPQGVERDAAAVRLSGGDADLARRALALVDSDEKAEAANHAARQAVSAPHIYGNYRTVRPLGSGGMGAVYLAERADGQFQQTVAVKVVAPHVAGDAFRERFLAERQILAGLSHPNIAKLLDGGVTPDGTPYLVLEYVDGQSLDQYCDIRKMGIPERLELFRKVCEPVEEAHRNLVVHRDLKPSNVLVTADGRPMLLDFGTAKLLAGNGAGAATATNLPMLTLRYSSPEQRSRSAITTSTDIFSLGVILYELLTGAWPFGDPSSPQQMLERFARETPMTAPHTAVTEESSLARSTNLRSLKNSLVGDLGSVLGKALAPVREDRYESVRALSADIGNWLAGLPVTAKPPSLSYRATKFLRRHWLPAVAATVFILGLLASTLFAVHEAKLARAEALRAEKVNQFLNDMLSSAGAQNFDPQKFTVAQMLDAAAPRLESSWKGDPLLEATLRKSLGSSYMAVQKYDLAKQQLETARATFQRLGRKSDEAESLFLLGVTAADAGVPAECVRYYRATLERLKALGKDTPPLLVFRTKQALADELSAVLNQDLEEAGKLFTEALALAERDPSIPRSEVANARTERGAMLLNQGKTAEAEAAFYQAIALYQQQQFEGAAKGMPFYDLAILNSRRDNFVAAKEFARQYYEATLKSIGPDHVRTALAKIMWARFRAETGETKEAVEQAREGMQVVRKASPPLSSVLWTPLTSASHVLNLAGRFAEAEPLAREQLAIVDHENLPEADARRAGTLMELGTALQGEKKYREATSTFERADRIYAQLGPVWALRAEQVRKKLSELRSQAKK
jgi:serine/threonine protein kinase